MSVVKLSSMPDPKREYVVEFPRLDGGLNTWELDYRLNNNESPRMKNMWWQDGALCCRDGQTRLTGESYGKGWSAYSGLFHDHGFFHIGDGLYHGEMKDADGAEGSLVLTHMVSGVPENKGSWFRYDEKLYYKNAGGYYCVEFKDGEFVGGEVEPYVPSVLINCKPSTGAGDIYQPENRLSPRKKVEYTTASGVTKYQLPVKEIDSVDKVTVDGVELKEGEGYTVDLVNGTVTFAQEPTHHNPVRTNTVDITYTKANEGAKGSVMDSPYAIVYGGDQDLCVVVGGCKAQPNAYFWCGNNSVEMDATYFPIEQYNFAGDSSEAITGFGKQQNMLVVFKEKSIGRTELGTQEMSSGRVLLTMNYTAINSTIGCDLPGSIQLIENNLVFANSRKGVYRIADTSSAYENNVYSISQKVDNNLVQILPGESASSFDDGQRYWLCCKGDVYAWDYALSSVKNPSWFYFDNIHACDFVLEGEHKFHLSDDGHVVAHSRNFADFDEAIHKVYRFATQNMGGYDRLKDVVGAIFAVRSDTDADIHIKYYTDYEEREDLTPIKNYIWHLSPRNLLYRYMGVGRFAAVARRKPGCRHVRHFTMELENKTAGTDMGVISAQIIYKYQGRDR